MKTDFYTIVKQFIKFGLVGVSNTVIGLGLYSILVYAGVHYQIANIVSFFISSLNGFLLNKFFVFYSGKHEGNTIKQFVRFYLVYVSSLFMGMGLLFVWIDICGMSVYLAPIFNLCFTIPYNYILSKHWVYNSKVCFMKTRVR